MSQPILSIITPVYNGQEYLAGFLQSIIDQNCSFIEHIIIDGKSQDNTVKILKEYADKYPTHIRWISEKDQGVGDALNKGIAIAQGKFIGIFCLDDRYEPNVLNEVTKILPSLPEPSFLVGNCNVWSEDGQLLYVNKPTGLDSFSIVIGKPYPHNPAAYFYHKSIHEKVGLYDIYDHYATDLDFLLRAFPIAKVHYVNKTWGNFRLLPDSKTVIARKSGQLHNYTRQAKERYLVRLPIVKRKFIKICLFLQRCKFKIEYYISRVKYYFTHPKEISNFLRKFLTSNRKNNDLR